MDGVNRSITFTATHETTEGKFSIADNTEYNWAKCQPGGIEKRTAWE